MSKFRAKGVGFLFEEEVRGILEQLKRRDSNLAESLNVSDLGKFQSLLENSLSDSLNALKEVGLKDAFTFAQWNSLWNQYGIYGEKKRENRNNFSSKTYKRGRLLLIDFGEHNIGLEFSYKHIGVVLKDFGGLVMVAPVTTDRGQSYPSNVQNAVVRVKSEEYNQFDHDSVVLLHQISSVAKNRVIKDLFKTVSSTPLMVEIDETLMDLYSPYSRDEKNRNERESLEKDKKIQELSAYIEILSGMGMAANTSVGGSHGQTDG